MKSKNLIVVTIVMCVVFGCQLAAQEPVGISTYHHIKIPSHNPGVKGENTVTWSTVIHQQGAAWLKIHLSKLRMKADDYVNVTNPEGVTLYQLKGSELFSPHQQQFKVNFNEDQSIELWLPALEGDLIHIQLVPGDSHKGVRGFIIDEVAVGLKPFVNKFPDIAIERLGVNAVCQSNDLWNIACFSGTTYYTRGQAVGRMLYKRSGNWYVGTGFLLSCENSKHFLTAFEHIRSQTVVDDLEVTFFHQYTTCAGSTMESTTTVFGDTLEDNDPDYNFSLIELTSKPATITPLEPLNREPEDDEYIYIPQHFDGDPKKIGFGTVYNTNSWDLSYYIDTNWESIGAPVIATDEHKVLGFNYWGYCPNYALKMKKIYTRIKNYIGCD